MPVYELVEVRAGVHCADVATVAREVRAGEVHACAFVHDAFLERPARDRPRLRAAVFREGLECILPSFDVDRLQGWGCGLGGGRGERSILRLCLWGDSDRHLQRRRLGTDRRWNVMCFCGREPDSETTSKCKSDLAGRCVCEGVTVDECGRLQEKI